MPPQLPIQRSGRGEELRRLLLEQHGCHGAAAVLGCKFPTISAVFLAENLSADTVWHQFARYRAHFGEAPARERPGEAAGNEQQIYSDFTD
jgi:hypothetical protein